MVKVEEMLSVIHPLSDVSIVTGDGWRRCILCCPLLPLTKAGCGMMEERTSGPLLPLMVEIEGGVENSGQFNYHCSVWPLLEAGVMTHHAGQAMHGVVMSGRKQSRHCVMEEW